uniref:SRCR domain-containing protein n=1 Tax=Petromyzon marinus TaxID=7757 RepID=S4R863_PETMA
ILKKVTEDVRLNNWEHSIQLQNITILTGPPGPKGNQGDMGHTGVPGMPGSKGERGFTGFLGLAGQKGYPGEKGDMGPRGPSGLPGTHGVRAEKGMSGEKGEKGDKGDKGDPDDVRVPVVRLVGGRRSNEGRVEVLHDGQWGTICNDNWNVQNANVVCKMLGYKSASASATIVSPYGQGSGPIWMDEVECSSTETDIRKCKFIGWGNHNCQHSEDVGVACVPL